MSWTSRVQGFRSGAESRFPVLSELTSRLVSGNLLDAGTRLAAQAFLASVPLLFALAAFAPQSVRDQLREVRVCERAWPLPKAGTRIAAWRWAVWLLALLIVVLLQAPFRNGFGAGLWLGVPVFFLVSTGVWLWTQHLLLANRVRWLPLLPGALLAAAATSALGLTARLYMPGAINRALGEYGSLGLVLTLLSWLIVVCGALTFAFTIGAVLAQEPPLNRYFGTDGSDN